MDDVNNRPKYLTGGHVRKNLTDEYLTYSSIVKWQAAKAEVNGCLFLFPLQKVHSSMSDPTSRSWTRSGGSQGDCTVIQRTLLALRR